MEIYVNVPPLEEAKEWQATNAAKLEKATDERLQRYINRIAAAIRQALKDGANGSAIVDCWRRNSDPRKVYTDVELCKKAAVAVGEAFEKAGYIVTVANCSTYYQKIVTLYVFTPN